MSMNEHELLVCLRSGKGSKAYKQLYRSFPKVRKMIKSQGGSKQDAEDVFQEGLIVLSRKAKDRDFKLTAALSTYLFAICKYIWWDMNARSRHVSSDFEIAADELNDLKAVIEQEKRYLKAEQAFDQLGKKCQQILHLFYLKKKRMEEIATQFNFKSAKVAKNQKYKCLKKAHEYYQNLYQS